MVDQADLSTINMLNAELQQIIMAIDIIDADGRIVNMTWASKIDEMPAAQVTINTADMPWPSQMKDTIKGFLVAREQKIRDEMAGLGVTGVDAAGRTAPPPTAPVTKRGARQ